jgi:hypothetical protein
MPKIEKLVVKTADLKAVISEHTAEELEHCRSANQGTDHIIHYVFEKIEEDK